MILDFNKKLSHYEKELKQLIDQKTKIIEGLLKQKCPNYEDFMISYQCCFEALDQFMKPIEILNYTKNSEATARVYSKLLKQLDLFHAKINQDSRIFDVLKIIRNCDNTLSETRIKILEDELLDFKRGGIDLSPEKQKELTDINVNLGQLANDFTQNVIKDTNQFELILEDASALHEMPKNDLNNAKCKINDKRCYRFTLHAPSFIAFMEYCSDRSLREQLYKAFATRGLKNEDLIEKIIKLRQQKAKLLGFQCFLDYALQKRIIEDQKQILDFCDNLLEASKPKALEELQRLKTFAEQTDGVSLEVYDQAYYGRKLSESLFKIKEEAYKPYFEQDQVLEKLFNFLERFFDIHFEKSLGDKTWHHSVKTFFITKDNYLIGKIYFDLEARRGKKDGAWMSDIVSYARDEKNNLKLPECYIACNFSKATAKEPSLLSLDDIITLFHEMGHALHHIFSTEEEYFVSGISGVEWDGVEFPSQFLENFATDKNILKNMARHYKTEASLDDHIIDQLIAKKNFQSAMGILRQLEFTLFDLRIHTSDFNKHSIQNILNNTRDKVGLLSVPEYNKFQCAFSHIFAGGYAGGYYSYKWAEVMSADAFMEFKDHPFNEQKTMQLYESILSKGGSRPFMQSFNEFLVRPLNVKSLLVINGIIEDVS